ncbi:MAG: serpin family protein [Clostridia bacterium]|nr:serpin family protein [Clostridia bacterium]
MEKKLYRRMVKGLLVCLIFLNITGCSGNSEPVKIQGYSSVNQVNNSYPMSFSSDKQFAFNLLDKLLEEEKGKNFFISPASIFLALSMVYNASDGETKKEMEKALELQGVTLEKLNGYCQSIIKSSTREEEGARLSIANSIWTENGIQLSEEFIKKMKDFYASEVNSLDFEDPKAVDKINDWVNDKTNQKIPKILNNLPSAAMMVLLNAIYFKGFWERDFDKGKTMDEMFNLPDHTQKSIPMMSQEGSYAYAEGEKFRVLSLPYINKSAQMLIFLPDKESSLNEFLTDFKFEDWKKYRNISTIREGKIKIPRFRMEYDIELNDILTNLGMEKAFNPKQADFSKLLSDKYKGNPIWLDKVIHKTYVNVNEEGTEAAGVTGAVMCGGLMEIKPEKFEFIADRPFFFVIHDIGSDLILFLGAVNEP